MLSLLFQLPGLIITVRPYLSPKLWHEGKKQLIKFNIIDGDYPPILSLDTSIAFVIVNLRHCDILPLGIQPPKDPASEYKDVFDGSLGKIPDTYKIVIDITCSTTCSPPATTSASGPASTYKIGTG
jgi:hypothetical protein